MEEDDDKALYELLEYLFHLAVYLVLVGALIFSLVTYLIGGDGDVPTGDGNSASSNATMVSDLISAQEDRSRSF